MEGGGPMEGVNFGLLNSLDSYTSYTIKDLQQPRLTKKDTYSSLNRCFFKTLLDWETPN